MENTIICQSCGMPMHDNQDLYGSNTDGSHNMEYCTYCYQKGQFTSSDSLEEMIETCVPFMIEDHPDMTADEAREQLNAFFPTLKRWQS